MNNCIICLEKGHMNCLRCRKYYCITCLTTYIETNDIKCDTCVECEEKHGLLTSMTEYKILMTTIKKRQLNLEDNKQVTEDK